MQKRGFTRFGKAEKCVQSIFRVKLDKDLVPVKKAGFSFHLG